MPMVRTTPAIPGSVSVVQWEHITPSKMYDVHDERNVRDRACEQIIGDHETGDGERADDGEVTRS